MLQEMEAVFFSESAEPLDSDTKERALAWLLERFPDEPVAAFSAAGFFVDMPDSIPLDGRTVVKGRSGLDSAGDDEGRQGLLKAWERLLTRGAAHYVVRRDLSDVTCYSLDLRDLHGIIFTLITGVSAQERDDTGDEDTHELARPTPRFASMRKDKDGYVTRVDEAFTEILGWTLDEIKGKRSLDLMHPDDHALTIENWLEMVAHPGPARRLRHRLRHKQGRWVWFEATNHNLLADPDHRCVACEMVDISDEMAAHEALRAREQLLERLTAALPVGVLEIDTERRVVFTNERLTDILGVSQADTLDGQLATVLPEDLARLQQAIETVLSTGSNADVEVGVAPPGGGGTRRCTITFRGLSHEDGTTSGAIACVDDVTESARLQDELERRATFDELTACHNRASVVRALEETIASGQGKDERAVMFVDLDGFKDINDCHGHAAGDELLRRVSSRLLDAVRDTDMVGRFGGDEFLVVCPDINGPEQAMRLADRLSDSIYTEDLGADLNHIECRVSIGVTWCSGHELTADAVVALADRAMYASKRSRTGRPILAPATANTATPPPSAPSAPTASPPASS